MYTYLQLKCITISSKAHEETFCENTVSLDKETTANSKHRRRSTKSLGRHKNRVGLVSGNKQPFYAYVDGIAYIFNLAFLTERKN